MKILSTFTVILLLLPVNGQSESDEFDPKSAYILDLPEDKEEKKKTSSENDGTGFGSLIYLDPPNIGIQAGMTTYPNYWITLYRFVN